MTDTGYDLDSYDYEYDDDGEWQPGECDNCYGETVHGPLGPVYCACRIGQGYDSEDCRCGPPDAA